jgi:hypothetical protein
MVSRIKRFLVSPRAVPPDLTGGFRLSISPARLGDSRFESKHFRFAQTRLIEPTKD